MVEFELDRFIELSGAIKLDDIDWDEARRIGLTDDEERIVRYIAATESYTILYMRDLLSGHSVKDPEITAFLSVWVYEELWHGRALDKLLAAAGRNTDSFDKVVANVSFREILEQSLASFAANLTPRWIATHMTWGAINEITAAMAYKALEAHTANPALKIICSRAAKQERKHFSFYYHQARKRLDGDVKAQKFCKFILRTFWKVVGSTVAQKDTLEFMAAKFFADAAGKEMLAEADATIRDLPGLDWFGMITPAVEKLIANHHQRAGTGDRLLPSATA
jgi:hypothetical protein